ncbi:kinase-like protein [Sparassis latifolia]
MASQPVTDTANWVDREERLEDYGPRGYHPVSVGDVLGSRYRVQRKLGWGVYSTVWLVRNERYASWFFGSAGPSDPSFRTALATGAPELHELEYLLRIHNEPTQHPGRVHVIDLLDHFYIEGPNGKHLCLVTELLSENVYSFSTNWKDERMPIPLVKRITRQVILGIDYLHNACDIIHTDIKPANILIALPRGGFKPSSAGVEVYVQEGPGDRSISRFRSNPLLFPIPSDLNSESAWSAFEAKLSDVGVACWADKTDEHFTPLIQSPSLRAPEVYVGAGWGKPADIWSLGCTVYEMIMGKSMIRAGTQQESIPFLHMVLFGDYPQNIVERGKYSHFFFNADGSSKFDIPRRLPLAMQIQGRGPPQDADMFVDFLNLMFKLDPAERASCEELLDHPWLAQ